MAAAGEYGTFNAGEATAGRRTVGRRWIAAGATALLLVAALYAAAGPVSTIRQQPAPSASLHLEEANKDVVKSGHATLYESMQKALKDVINMQPGKPRWVILGFDGKRKKVLPLISAVSTLGWEADWKSFTDALPDDDAAFALYAFDYWKDMDDFVRVPILFSWRPAGVSMREMALAGNALGVVVLATQGVDRVIDLSEAEAQMGYEQMCVKLGFGAKQCKLAEKFHDCPFPDTSPDNPCKQKECRGGQPRNGGLSPQCCEYISEYCIRHKGEDGCHKLALRKFVEDCNVPLRPPQLMDLRMATYARCDRACRNPCLMKMTGAEIWAKCSTCTNDGKHQCYPGAVGFYDMACCGEDPMCKLSESQDPYTCSDLTNHGCVFTARNLCGEVRAAESRAKQGAK